MAPAATESVAKAMSTNIDQDTARRDLYYGALVEAWIANRMEKDRTLLALAAGGVGLLVTLLTTTGVRSTCHLLIYVLAATAFLAAIVFGLWIFHANTVYVELELAEFDARRPPRDDPKLDRLDWLLMSSFAAGVVLSIAAAVVSAWPNEEGKEMTDRKDTKINVEISHTSKEFVKSLTGVGKVRPGGDESQKPQTTTPSKPAEMPATSGGGELGKGK